MVDKHKKKKSAGREEAILNMIGGMMFVFSPDGRIVDCQFKDTRDLYRQPEEFLGKRIEEVLPEDIARTTLTKIAAAQMSGKKESYRYTLETDRLRYYEARFSSLENGEVVALIKEITEIEELKIFLNKKAAYLLPDSDTGKAKKMDLKLSDIFNIVDLQELQDEFSAVTGTSSLITSPDGRPITKVSLPTRLCGQMILQDREARSKCMFSLKELRAVCKESPAARPCLGAGLWEAGVAIKAGGHDLARWMIGQVRDESQSPEEFIAHLEGTGIDKEAAMAAYMELPVFSEEKFKSVSRLLNKICLRLSEDAYDNLRQAELLVEVQQNREELFASYEQIEATMQEIMAMEETLREQNDRLRESEITLRESENALREILDFLPDPTLGVDLEGRIILWNKALERLTGRTKEEMLGKGDYEYALPIYGERRPLLVDYPLMYAQEQLEYTSQYKYVRFENNTYMAEAYSELLGDGTGVHLWGTASPLIDREGNIVGSIQSMRDVTEEKGREELLRLSEEKYRLLFTEMKEGLTLHELVFDERGEVVDMILREVNPAFSEILGIDPEIVLHTRFTEFFNMEKLPYAEEVKAAISGKGRMRKEMYFERFDKTLLLSIFSYREGYLGTLFTDISERKAYEDEITYLSYHDSLTGLYNRRFLNEEMLRLDQERNMPLTLIMADVNGLKLTNDAFGHLKGDEVLRLAAQTIKKECRADDIIARVGGDEFVIFLPRTDIKIAEGLITRIRNAFAREVLEPLELSVSFGCASKTKWEEELTDIYRQAEDIMYERKLYESPSIRGNTIRAIVQTMFEKLPGEKEHSDRVGEISALIGAELGYDQDRLNELKTAGLMHDIGKITLDEAILFKRERLSDEEWKEIKRHPEAGYRILSSVNEMAQLAEYVLYHHENWDGSGYPRRLGGEEIPLQSRIIRIADSYDAMISSRVYREVPLTPEQALGEIMKFAGVFFDPELASAFQRVWQKL